MLTLSSSESTRGRKEESGDPAWHHCPHGSGLTASETQPHGPAFGSELDAPRPKESGPQKHRGTAFSEAEKQTREPRGLLGIRAALVSVSSGAASLEGLLSLRQ